MTIRWTKQAADNLEEIHAYLVEHLPELAHSTMVAIHQASQSLTQMPERGRPGFQRDTRELLLGKLPYILVYRVRLEVVEILYLHHTARRRSARS